MKPIRVMSVFGTRPEAIKMCPLVKELESRDKIESIVCVTGQHREMLKSVLSIFDVTPDYDLDIMKSNQTLFDVTIEILEKLKNLLSEIKPDLVLVHGDTSTTFVTSLACFYLGIKIGHVEAGLRTYNISSPFPEEFNRRAVTLVAEYNFAPTELAKAQLIKEGVDESSITVTGNTAIDSLHYTISSEVKLPIYDWIGNDRLVLVTAHRRENIGENMESMFNAIKRIVSEFSDIKVVYPIHLNPRVREIANRVLGNNENIRLIEPLDVREFHNLMSRAHIILTDSGGIQEEAPSLKVPVLVMRDTTERPEGVDAGTLKVVGTTEDGIYSAFLELLNNEYLYKRMTNAQNPYGDGKASIRIVDTIVESFSDNG